MILIVAGSRAFTDYNLMCSVLNEFIENTPHIDITIISGHAIGADALGELYAKEHNIPCLIMPADWDKYGNAAGIIRNEEMAIKGTHCVIFWDSKSKGTKHMIGLCTKYNLVHKIVYY